MWTYIVIAFCGIICVSCNTENFNNSSLKLVFGVFRHGQKTNDEHGTYPNDPYNNITYHPYGLKELTNEGKQTAYNLGKTLRKRYNTFLGDTYSPKSLYAASTHSPRAKSTLQLVLAGLYPPKDTVMEWETSLNWQPIPYEHLSNQLLGFAMLKCKKFVKLYDAFMNSPEGQTIEEKYSPKYKFISQSTGLSITRVFDLFFLYFRLTCEKEWGLTLPSWTDGLYPGYFENAVMDFYSSSANDSKRKQLSGGFLLKNMMEEILLKIESTNNNPDLFLYSGHEFTVVYILNALNVYSTHIPDYGACLLVELYQQHKKYWVKVLYLKNPKSEPHVLVVPGCGILCEFTKFQSLLSSNVPAHNDECED